MRILQRQKNYEMGSDDHLMHSLLNPDGSAVVVVETGDGSVIIGWRYWDGTKRVYDTVIRFCWFYARGLAEAEYRRLAEHRRSQKPVRKPRSAWDYQRQRVYNWEKQRFHYDEGLMSLDECRALVAKVWKAKGRYGLPPKVTDGRGRRAACSCGGTIKLPRWARLNWVVLHEMAHELTPDQHGPKFMKMYVDLLVGFGGWSRVALMNELAAFKIDVAE